jgi:hypothetical protein
MHSRHQFNKNLNPHHPLFVSNNGILNESRVSEFVDSLKSIVEDK